MNEINKTTFAPKHYIKSGVTNIYFYTKAFGAIELRRFTNDSSIIHFTELSIEGMLFHLHEESLLSGQFSPQSSKGITAMIGLFVPDVDLVIAMAVAAGAEVVSPAQSYDYGYRQGEIRDSFGHVWMIEMKI